MKEFFGWVQASDMAAIYVHLSGRDVDSALLKVYGMEDKEEKQETQLKPITCPRCMEINQFSNAFCKRCGMILEERFRNEKIQQDLERKKADKILDNIMEDQEFREMFMRKMMELSV
jgi:hypothetical protein